MENEHDPDAVQDETDLAARTIALEQRLRDVEAEAERRIRLTELKAEAARAGIHDLDGLKLLDDPVFGGASQTPMEDAAKTISRFKQQKPWLFRSTSSSSRGDAPQAAPPKRKLATEMSLEEWRMARAELLRRK